MRKPLALAAIKDAPEGKAWKCPDCGCLSTLGGNAAFHAAKARHGKPSLVAQPDVDKPEEPKARKPTLTEANAAARIVAAIEKDFSDRRGLRQEWEGIDPETKNSIRREWHRIALKEIRDAAENARPSQPPMSSRLGACDPVAYE